MVIDYLPLDVEIEISIYMYGKIGKHTLLYTVTSKFKNSLN